MNFLKKKSWNPYVVGALIGLLAVSTLAGIAIGGLAGSGLYAHFYPSINSVISKGPSLEYYTINQLLGVNQWTVIGVLAVMVLIIFIGVEMYEGKRKVNKRLINL